MGWLTASSKLLLVYIYICIYVYMILCWRNLYAQLRRWWRWSVHPFLTSVHITASLFSIRKFTYWYLAMCISFFRYRLLYTTDGISVYRPENGIDSVALVIAHSRTYDPDDVDNIDGQMNFTWSIKEGTPDSQDVGHFSSVDAPAHALWIFNVTDSIFWINTTGTRNQESRSLCSTVLKCSFSLIDAIFIYSNSYLFMC